MDCFGWFCLMWPIQLKAASKKGRIRYVSSKIRRHQKVLLRQFVWHPNIEVLRHDMLSYDFGLIFAMSRVWTVNIDFYMVFTTSEPYEPFFDRVLFCICTFQIYFQLFPLCSSTQNLFSLETGKTQFCTSNRFSNFESFALDCSSSDTDFDWQPENVAEKNPTIHRHKL